MKIKKKQRNSEATVTKNPYKILNCLYNLRNNVHKILTFRKSSKEFRKLAKNLEDLKKSLSFFAEY